MDPLAKQMQEMYMKTPERKSRNGSMMATPGLPSMMEKPTVESFAHVHEAFPDSPQACAYPVVVPHRIFVGGFPVGTTDHELRSFFEPYGYVRDVKIIRDEAIDQEAGPKYVYGFVTFSSEDEAKRVVDMNKLAKGRAFKFQGRYLTVNEAMKKPSNKFMKLDFPMGLNPMICRDQNGRLMTLYPSYTVVSEVSAAPQSQPVAAPPIFVVQPSMFPVAPTPLQQQQPTVPSVPAQVAYPQYGGPVPASNPPVGYYQQ